MPAIWYEAAMAHDCVVPFESAGTGLIKMCWEIDAACWFSEGGPGIIIRDYLHPDGVEFDTDSPVEDFTEVFGNSIGKLVVTPAFRDYDIVTACVRIDEPYSKVTLMEPYGDGDVDELAVWLAEHVGAVTPSTSSRSSICPEPPLALNVTARDVHFAYNVLSAATLYESCESPALTGSKNLLS